MEQHITGNMLGSGSTITLNSSMASRNDVISWQSPSPTQVEKRHKFQPIMLQNEPPMRQVFPYPQRIERIGVHH